MRSPPPTAGANRALQAAMSWTQKRQSQMPMLRRRPGAAWRDRGGRGKAQQSGVRGARRSRGSRSVQCGSDVSNTKRLPLRSAARARPPRAPHPACCPPGPSQSSGRCPRCAPPWPCRSRRTCARPSSCRAGTCPRTRGWGAHRSAQRCTCMGTPGARLPSIRRPMRRRPAHRPLELVRYACRAAGNRAHRAHGE